MTRISLIAALFALPASSLFAGNLERLEIATEMGGKQLSTFLVSRAPELKPNLPNWEWDDDYRSAGGCFLDKLEAGIGADGVEKYITIVEAHAARPITSLADTANQPAELSQPVALSAMQSCGLQEIIMKRMTESGLMGAMMNEGMMAKLGG